MEYTHRLNLQGREVTLTWVGQIASEPARVYGLAFTSQHEILLVSGGSDDPYRWLPGGGIEHGETPAGFLDTLEWGHSDPKAAMLLELELKYKVK